MAPASASASASSAAADGAMNNGTNHSNSNSNSNNATSATGGKKKEAAKPMATIGQTMQFMTMAGARIQIIFAIGALAGIANGLVYPILAYLFSSSFTDIAGAANNGLAQLRELAYTFMIVGVYALVCATIQGWCFETVAAAASQKFRLTWFRALLRQDPAFFDVYDIGGLAGQIGPNANKYQRGLGRKLGEIFQFATTGVGGLGFAFFVSWRVALVVLTVIPFVALSAMATVYYNQSKGQRAAASYKTAGSVAYSSVSSIKTVLSLNAIPEMLRQYSESTTEAFYNATSVLLNQGLANGFMLGTFLLLYAVLTLYGSALVYRDIEDSGCDPSGSVDFNSTCDSSGPDVFGAMLGVAFAGQGISQCGTCIEAFTAARVAVYEALSAMNRKPGSDQQTIYHDPKEDTLMNTTRHSKKTGKSGDVEATGEKEIKAILPKYEINSSDTGGDKPKDIKGHISIENVNFAYPTRPADPILTDFSTEIVAGQVVAFVGPSGSGKSTVVSLLERFYDPQAGTVKLDGTNVKDINVSYLRSLIGYVGQEPTLFATTIRNNISYGNPDATQEQIEEAAKLANAHDFISQLPDGYDTQVGDKGGQLSGGQKQRIAIARVLVGDPKILLLDEATSALDAESELVVQEALDNILDKKKITTIVIAHRLSTIRNADTINVVVSGKVAERGTHDELMATESYYRKLVEKQEGTGNAESASSSGPPSRSSSVGEGLNRLDSAIEAGSTHGELPHIAFKHVHFAYPTRPQKKVLKNFSLNIARGDTVALVGPSGGGKSTTVGLIERFYDVAEGSLEFRGVDVRSLNVSWYRDQIGYVGQEPVLFNDTIARNISYGAPGATREEIEEACRQANCYDFIKEFPEGFDTPVGERGIQVSGGQKQRIAIARALVKKPQLLILDEATSALDNESEGIVQAAIDKLMESRDHTVILIAHRLSTIRNADKIAVVAHGHVVEYGSHDELMALEDGRYKRLFDSSKRGSTLDSVGLRGPASAKAKDHGEEEDEEEINWEEKINEEEDIKFDAKRARSMASEDSFYFFIGMVGAIFSGGVFPMWGVLFSETISLLFQQVLACPNPDPDFPEIPPGFDSCSDYWDSLANDMQDRSFKLAIYWACVFFGCILGALLNFWGFGNASERLNKRVRDACFKSLMRQEVAYFDKRSVGRITSQLQDDAARIQAFSGEPVRAMAVALSSVLVGIVLSFAYMWEFALLAIGCVPLMGFATSIEMKQFLGEDHGADGQDELNSPGGIIVETLLNIRTVSALTLEERRYSDYEKALAAENSNQTTEALMGGFTSGLSMFIQQWINALQLWFGGWILFKLQPKYDLNDFLIANFAILFALFGLGAAFQDISDKKAVEESAKRVFYLLDRVSAIDPLSEDGKKIN